MAVGRMPLFVVQRTLTSPAASTEELGYGSQPRADVDEVASFVGTFADRQIAFASPLRRNSHEMKAPALLNRIMRFLYNPSEPVALLESLFATWHKKLVGLSSRGEKYDGRKTWYS